MAVAEAVVGSSANVVPSERVRDTVHLAENGIYPKEKGASAVTSRRTGQKGRLMAQRKSEKEKRRGQAEEEERKIKRFIHRKTRKRNEDEAKVLKRDQGKGGRERKTEWERKARASERASV